MSKYFIFIGLLFTVSWMVSCEWINPESEPEIETASVTTLPMTGITETSAEAGGEVVSDGGSAVTERGICWSTSPEPTLTDNHTENGAGSGSFTGQLTGLECSTTYYVRAYATNSAGTAYGDEETFTAAECTPAPGEFLIADGSGTWIMTHQGDTTPFTDGNVRHIEVLDSRIYIKNYDEVSVYHRDGSLLETVTIDSRIGYPYSMCVLPGGELAFLDNKNDSVSFTSSSGELLDKISITGLPGDDQLQHVSGVAVDNSLVFSEDGNQQIMMIDLDTYEKSVFRDFSHLSGYLGDIEYADGTYYLTQSTELYSFRESEEEQLICEMPEGNNTAVAVLGDFAYVTSNFGDKVYRVNLNSGDYEVIVNGADYPQDIELIR